MANFQKKQKRYTGLLP